MKLLLVITHLCIQMAFVHSEDINESQSAPVVRTTHGLVEGTIATSYYMRPYIKFMGIPYAKPPVGILRFEPPKPAIPWRGTFKARHPTRCMQLVHVPDVPGGIADGVEDCLHVNVYVPRATTDGLDQLGLDVIVHIHGGSYSFGSGDTFRPDFIMDREVVHVTFNYRLGIFGFLCTESVAHPGNMALRDQIAALRWVQRNIRAFGGNPRNVLLTGLSAGAGSTHYLTVSPLTRGLFHRAHSLSGSALRAMQTQPWAKAQAVGRALGCDLPGKLALINCLKLRPAQQLLEAQRAFRMWLYNPIAPFAAVVDKWSPLPVLPKHPIELLKDGRRINDIPYIMSFTSAEGLYPAAEFLYKDEYLEELNTRWEELAPVILNLGGMVPEGEVANVSKLVRERYFGDKSISLETFAQVVDMVGDRLYLADMDIALRYHARAIQSPIYAYMFDYMQDMLDYATMLAGKPERHGVSHGDDLIMMLPNAPYENATLSARDENLMNYLLDMWINFAKNGKFDNWTELSKSLDAPLRYRRIGEELKDEMLEVPEIGNRRFWETMRIRQGVDVPSN